MSNGMDRRDFLKKAIVTGAGIGAVAGGAGRAAHAQDSSPGEETAKKVPRRKLGGTGEEIPILLMGCAQKFDSEYDKMLHRAYKEGVDYLDTALVYAGGWSHKTLEPFIKQVGDRKKLWITSKAPHKRNRADVGSFSKGLDTCLQQLDVEYLDLFFMHALNNTKYLAKEYRKMGEAMKKSGKTRFFGFSCHDGNVVDLLNISAKVGGIDAIMFRYDFSKYGDKELNKAIDRCVKAKIGLIAMKTQRSVPGDKENVVEWKSSDWTLAQAKLKAVWADERIDSAVSHIDTLQKLDENVAAAKSYKKLSMHDFQQLNRMAACTSAYACQGCNHLCESKIDGDLKVADALRFLMYSECYGEADKARHLYHELSPAEREFANVDLRAATAACPEGIDIPARLERARELLA